MPVQTIYIFDRMKQDNRWAIIAGTLIDLKVRHYFEKTKVLKIDDES